MLSFRLCTKLRAQDLRAPVIEGGFPHSEICGSKVVRTSPQLIAAYHVLHRLSAPRHPPDALTTLDYSYDRCPLGSGHRSNKKDLSSDFSKDMFLLARHIRRSRLRAVAGAQELGSPACRICRLFTISNIRAAPQGEGANLNKIQNAKRAQWTSGMIKGMVEPVGIEPTT